MEPSIDQLLEDVQETLDFRFRSPQLLKTALTHPSYQVGSDSSEENNQRLEFLGDAVLELILTGELFRRYPGVDEGRLTKARAQLVNKVFLAEQAKRLKLGKYLLMSHGEIACGGRKRVSALADAFEALVGAMFMDAGFEAVNAHVLGWFQNSFEDIHGIPNLNNPKGELQERLQAGATEPPRYVLLSISGPDHNRIFEAAVYHRDQELGRGTGKSKKAAESDAARNALSKLQENREAAEAGREAAG